MATNSLRDIRAFPDLVRYLEDELDWPLQEYGFDELTFEYTPAELGLKEEDAAHIKAINQLRPLASGQPWGIFFVEFENKKLPVVVLRRILSHLVIKKRASANKASAPAWHAEDLLFVTAFGEDGADNREIAFAHFHQTPGDLPTLHVLGWDGSDTPLKLANVDRVLHERLHWPEDEGDAAAWREAWRGPFKHKIGHVIRTADLLAEELARLARGIRDKAKRMLAAESDKGPLTKLFKAFQTALIHDLTPDSFADTYAQTITYGLLTAAISRTEMSEGRHGTALLADDIANIVPVTNPFLKEMLQTFLKVGGRKGGIDFDELGIQDVVELLRGDETDLPAVIADFGNKNPNEDPVIHFYEHFLAAYDKPQKKQRGVFYTPQPVVSYIVRSVHELLQTEFGLEDGLASTITWGEMAKRNPDIRIPEGTESGSHFVTILDPATGTATFLVEVINVIHRTLMEIWAKQGLNESQRRDAWNEYVPSHLLPRLYGYELMMAPYAIAHMKIGLKLFETGYRFGSEERVRVYLTNTLEPASDAKGSNFDLEVLAPALAHEAQAVNTVKRGQRFTIVIGNPPYAGHSVNNHIPAIVDLVHDYKVGLPELDRPGQGKWLQDDYVKFIRLGEHILSSVSAGVLGYITNHSFLDNPTFKGMRKHLLSCFPRISLTDLHGNAKKKERMADGTADENVFEIQQGAAIMVGRRGSSGSTITAHDLSGTREQKYSWLAAHSALTAGSEIHPAAPLYLFRAQDSTLSEEYGAGVPLPELMAQNGEPAPGFVTTHDEFAISWTASESAEKVERLLETKSETEARAIFTLCSQNQWNYARAKAALADGSWRKHVVKVLYRPFDFRWTVYSSHVAVHRRERVMRHMLGRTNLGIICTRQTKDQWGVLATRNIAAHKTCGAYDINFLFPLYLLPESGELSLGHDDGRVNLAPPVVRRFGDALGLQIHKQIGLPAGLTPEDIFHYAYAVFHSPGYRTRYAEFLKIDFPRLPLTRSLVLFRALAKLGGELVALHLLESPKVNAFITRFVGEGDNSIPKKPTYKDGAVWINATQRFEGVPEAVWNFHVGGYQVCEKWLKDRKGRTLSAEDIVHYQRVVVALNETIRLMAEIDRVIETHGGWPGAFQAANTGENPAA